MVGNVCDLKKKKTTNKEKWGNSSLVLLNRRQSNLTPEMASRFDPLYLFGSEQFFGLVQVVVVCTIQLCCQVLRHSRGRNEP